MPETLRDTACALADSRTRGPTSLRWAALFGLAMALAMVAGVAALARVHVSQIPVSTVVAVRLLRVEDRPDLGLTLRDASTGAVLANITGEAGFLRLTLRGLAQQRWRDGLSPDPPFRLTRWADGRLTLDDPPTGRHIELEAFGHTNEAAFAALLAPEASPR